MKKGASSQARRQLTQFAYIIPYIIYVSFSLTDDASRYGWIEVLNYDYSKTG